MWIRTTIGEYINSDNLFRISITKLKSGDCAVTASSWCNGNYTGHKKDRKETRRGGSR